MKHPTMYGSTFGLSFLFLCFCLPGSAQETIVTYLKKNGGPTATKDAAAYTRIVRTVPNDAGLYELNEYYDNDNLKRHGWIKKADPRVLRFEGWVDTYYEDGSLEATTCFADHQRTDTASTYYRNGVLKERKVYLPKPKEADALTDDTYKRQVYYADSLGNVMVQNGHGEARIRNNNIDVEQGKYVDGLREGHWTGTFQKGKYHFEEWYENGIVVRGVSTDNKGKTYPYEQREIQPEYPGGLHTLRVTVGKNFRYPKKAIQQGVSGLLVTSFVVNKEGDLQDFDSIQDLGYGTAAAGKEAIRRAGKWKPGYQRGIPVNVRYTLPIRLNLKVSRKPASPSSRT